MNNYSKQYKWKKIMAISGLAVMLGMTSSSIASADGHDNDNRDNNYHYRWNNDHRTYWQRGCNNNGRWNRWTVSFGKVDSIDSNKITVKYGDDREFTVDAENTRIINRKGEKIDLGDIKDGDRIVVRGERKWDSDHKEFSVDAQSIRDIDRD